MRVVPVKVEGGNVTVRDVGREIKAGEYLAGAIGHFPETLSPQEAEQEAERILRQRIGGISAARVPGIVPVKIDTVQVTGRSFEIMRDEVAVNLFTQAVERAGYGTEGFNAEMIQASIALVESRGDIAKLTLPEARVLSGALSILTGDNWCVPTEDEWLEARKLVGRSLSGNSSEWTSTQYHSSGFIIRHINREHLDDTNPAAGPAARCAVRLIKKKSP